MYIGDTNDLSGLHNMLFEIMDNSIDEALIGVCSKIIITIYKNGFIGIKDNGRGIPVDIHSSGKPACEVIMCVLHAGGKFDQNSYQISGGLHGVGLSVVNALSQHLEMIVHRNGKKYKQLFSRGKAISDLSKIGKSKMTGTFIRFKPDNKIFTETKFNYSLILSNMKEKAYLLKHLSIEIHDKFTNKSAFFCSKNGLFDFITELTESQMVFTKPIHVKKNIENQNSGHKYSIEFILQWTNAHKENIICFTNNIKNKDGGTHLYGFRSGLAKAINNHIHTNYSHIISSHFQILSEDTREGISAIISVKTSDPQFSSQIKEKLITFSVKKIVHSVVFESIKHWLNSNKYDAKKVCLNVILAARSRIVARKNKELSKQGKIFDKLTMSRKLSVCHDKSPFFSELFIVEGESAGGSAKNARNRQTQAVLPLKGKILNVERAKLNQILANNELITLISAIGINISTENFHPNKINYHKIILMTDADIDGSHIRTLLLTFFFRQMQYLIEHGFLYISLPPLYRCALDKKNIYMKNKKNLNSFLIKQTLKSCNFFFSNKLLKKNSLLNLINTFFCYTKLSKKLISQFNIYISKYFIETSNLRSSTFYDLLYQNPSMTYFIKKKYNNFSKQDLIFIDHIQNVIKTNLFQNLEKLLLKIRAFDYNSFQIKTNEQVSSFDKLDKFIIHFTLLIQQNTLIQRYKGLGEMNANQLWETTMNPLSRELLQVKIKNSSNADYLFSKLMGEDPSARKLFIERFSSHKDKNKISIAPFFFF